MYAARRSKERGFTLVEILIVVIILGILAAIVIPQFTSASTDARQNSTKSLLQTIRSQVELYKLQHNDNLPGDDDGGGSPEFDEFWGDLTTRTNAEGTGTGTTNLGPYLQSTPVNPLNGQTGVVMNRVPRS
ncbi:MAG TPA: prepilin-type N-terminal cleavage/methylation domain-containing protein, partial [Tepidisphaeraceae bacterium]|nr:prepilin-type N-terminal cleavage/methylation domain-containing protein [Tepidisphaeraceae bacterium]